MRNANAALDRAGIPARGMTSRPADFLRPDPPLLTPDGARIDTIAQRQGIHSQALGELVDRHLHAPGARRVSWTAHGGSGPGVGEDIELRRCKVWTVIERLGEIADSGVQADARGAVALDRNRRQRSVASRADADALMGGRAIARVHLLLWPGQGETDGRSRLTRQRDGEAALGAECRFRAETAAHAVDHDPHLIRRQVKRLGEFAAHPGGELSGNMDRQAVGAWNRFSMPSRPRCRAGVLASPTFSNPRSASGRQALACRLWRSTLKGRALRPEIRGGPR